MARARAGVRIVVEDDRITELAAGDPEPADTRLRGLTIPGLANAHSHAFHRALRGRTHDGAGTFWTWRDAMYEVAAGLDPESLYAHARNAYVEMVAAGITVVGEFHYAHHGPGGRPYGEPNAMGDAVVAAAADVGIRLTLLDTCYLRADEDVQRRFSDGDARAWAERATARVERPGVRLGAAIHSVRAVDSESMQVVADTAREHDWPLHLHLSEQPAENDACLAETGMTPAALVAAAGVLGPSTTAVHATHVTPGDIALLGTTGTSICLCPTTERDLADGVGLGAAMAEAGSPLCVGSDSHAVIDLFEEARCVELHQRLVSGTRGHHSPVELLATATANGYRALGWDGGELRPGALGGLRDRRARRLRSEPRRRAGRVHGHCRRRAPRHRGRGDVAVKLLTNIGRLFTGEGVIEDAAIAIDGDRISWQGRRVDAPPVDDREDLGGALVTPGLVDAHTHPVYAGDRLAEIAARSEGATYAELAAAGGGIGATVRATRAASREELAAAVEARLREWPRHGATAVEAKTGYHLDREGELADVALLASLRGRPGLPGLSITFLAAHAVPDGVSPDEYADAAAAWSAEAAAVRRRQLRRVLRRGVLHRRPVPAGSARRRCGRAAAPLVHADELARTGGAQLAAELGAASADHLLCADEDDAHALAAAGVTAVLCPVTALSMGALPPVRALRDAGVTLALGTDHNPGTSGLTDMTLVVALAINGLGLSVREALVAATARGSRADLVAWDAEHEGVFVWQWGVRPGRVWIAGKALVL